MRRQLIINADDFGYDPAVTRGMEEAMRAGVVTSATFMVNTPFSEDAARSADGLSLGLHLNLARHPPLSTRFPQGLLIAGELSESLAGELTAAAVADETRAQLGRFQALLGRPATHVDVHKHLHRHPAVLQGLLAAAREAGLPVRAMDRGLREKTLAAGVATTDAFAGEAGGAAYWSPQQLEADLARLGPGITEWMCHPGYAPSHVKSGYSAQREVELATFLSSNTRRALEAAGIERVDFRALARR